MITNQRTFLKSVASLLPAGIFLPVHKGNVAEIVDRISEKITGRDYHKEISVKPFINAAGAPCAAYQRGSSALRFI